MTTWSRRSSTRWRAAGPDNARCIGERIGDLLPRVVGADLSELRLMENDGVSAPRTDDAFFDSAGQQVEALEQDLARG